MIPRIPFTIETAALIPQTDLFGKSDALAKLQTLEPGMLGVAEHDAFKWWLFFPTLDKQYKAEMFGRSDQSVKHLVLKKLSRKIKTELCDDAAEAVNLLRH